MTETAADVEEQRLHYWHIDQFCDLGFESYQAELLELSGVDWRQAQELLDRGCTIELAMAILR